ncbi:uncharacterized protein CG4449 [Teleopsis dalmanni]|uniref:uncharacterized protein CG4449 n=1 Tax=Teleopsis dalmanni TaxID=139649 RepID=UPI0018CF12D2|nr:uncharacterized protein CG4449 [Teleopsis dalmanni]
MSSEEEDYDIFANLKDIQKNLEDGVNLAFENLDDDSDKSISFSMPETPKNKKKKSAPKNNPKKAPKDPADKNPKKAPKDPAEKNNSIETINFEDFAPINTNYIAPMNRRNTRRNNNLMNDIPTCSRYATNDIDLSLNSSSTTGVQRRSRRITRAKRSYNNSVAAASSDIQYVDLTTTPLPLSNDVINLESEPEDDTKSKPEMSFEYENPEMFIQIIWVGMYETFTLRKYQKFSHIFKILAERENTNIENLAFNIDSEIIFPDDTPDSIDYKPYQFIKGRVLNTKIETQYKHSKPLKNNDENVITVKIQSDRWKHPKSMQVVKTEKFGILIIKLSEELNIQLNQIKLRFDDDYINPNSTPEEIDLENDDIIDLHLNL